MIMVIVYRGLELKMYTPLGNLASLPSSVGATHPNYNKKAFPYHKDYYILE
jgi:hypothetical protein